MGRTPAGGRLYSSSHIHLNLPKWWQFNLDSPSSAPQRPGTNETVGHGTRYAGSTSKVGSFKCMECRFENVRSAGFLDAHSESLLGNIFIRSFSGPKPPGRCNLDLNLRSLGGRWVGVARFRLTGSMGAAIGPFQSLGMEHGSWKSLRLLACAK